MAKTKISEFSPTPANNTDIDNINIAEGCAPSGINDAIRELMAQLKDFQAGTAGDSFNGPIGSTTAVTGAFTNVTASGTLGVTGVATLGNGAVLGTPASVTLTNGTGLPIATGVSGLGTGVATALAVNVGSAGAPVLFNGALGTPSSGTVTNLTGTASININGTVGATTATTGAFTTLAASGAVTLSGGTANGVAYLNGSKVLTTGSALTFDGTILGVGAGATSGYGSLQVRGGYAYVNEDGSNTKQLYLRSNYAGIGPAIQVANTDPLLYVTNNSYHAWFNGGSEQMRLTSTGLGIGTSSPVNKLHVVGTSYINVGAYATGYALTLGASSETSRTYQIGMVTGGNLAIYDSGAAATRLVLDTSGNLGIGTSSPAAKLDVAGGAKLTGTVVTTTGSDAFSAGAGTGTSIRVNALFKGTDASGNARTSYIGTNIYGTDGSMEFSNNIAGLTMSIAPGGNVGIGTSSPSSKLEVLNAGDAIVTVTGNTASGNVAAVDFKRNGGTVNASIRSQSVGNNDAGEIFFSTRPFGGALTERIRLNSSGNVGIGTSSPSASAILDAQSTTKGVRMPNMTTAQKNAIASPAAGLMVFDTTLAKLCVYTGAAWQTITSI